MTAVEFEKYSWLKRELEKATKARERAEEKQEEAWKNYNRYVRSSATVETIKKYTKALERASAVKERKIEEELMAHGDFSRYVSYLRAKGCYI